MPDIYHRVRLLTPYPVFTCENIFAVSDFLSSSPLQYVAMVPIKSAVHITVKTGWGRVVFITCIGLERFPILAGPPSKYEM